MSQMLCGRSGLADRSCPLVITGGTGSGHVRGTLDLERGEPTISLGIFDPLEHMSVLDTVTSG